MQRVRWRPSPTAAPAAMIAGVCLEVAVASCRAPFAAGGPLFAVSGFRMAVGSPMFPVAFS
eukprot:9313210-Lingulodinium_polyedra.AAC.1